MPGPVSDSYDPEFGTGANADEVREAIERLSARVGELLGPQLHDIVGVVQGKAGPTHTLRLSERELRIIRFGLNRAAETI